MPVAVSEGFFWFAWGIFGFIRNPILVFKIREKGVLDDILLALISIEAQALPGEFVS